MYFVMYSMRNSFENQRETFNQTYVGYSRVFTIKISERERIDHVDEIGRGVSYLGLLSS